MIYYNFKNKPAFTMLELVFVIVVLGILASLALPRLERDKKQEVADTILANIRYTQHLAQQDNMHEYNKPKWQQKFWKIMFRDCSNDYYYMIGSDTNMGDDANGLFAENEAATDPVNGKPMFNTCAITDKSGYSSRIFLTDNYDVDTVTASASCNTGGANGNTNMYIGFDHLGRPHYGYQTSSVPDYSSYLTNACIFTFTMIDGKSFQISIQPETGYAQIVGQPNS